jgi:hypothetical protein
MSRDVGLERERVEKRVRFARAKGENERFWRRVWRDESRWRRRRMRRRDGAAPAFFAARRHVKVRLKSARESESASWISEDEVGDF